MAAITRKTKTGYIWIPRPFEYKYNIKIDRTSATDTITSDVIKVEWNKPVTQEVGKFTLHLDNNEDTYTDLYTGGEKLEIYLDWLGASPSTLVFKGVIESIEKRFDSNYGNYLMLKGVHISGSLLDIKITETYESVSASTILSNIIDKYASDFTHNNVDTTGSASTEITVKWSEKPFWQCVKDICTLSNCDAYVDDNYDFHFFEQNSKECMLDAVVWEDNLLEIKGLELDTSDIYNRIIVYGEDNKGLPIIATAENTTSQSLYGIKEKVINDKDISTFEEAQARANAELEVETTLKGSAKCYGMTYVQPGDLIWISDPIHKIHGQYRVYNIKNKIEGGYFITEVQVSKPTKGLQLVIRKGLEKDIALEKIPNPNRMQYSYNFEFDSDIGTHSSTEITGGKLQLQAGASDGTWMSPTRTTTSSVSYAELRVEGQDLDSSHFYVSADNGTTWDELTIGEVTTLTNTGIYLKVKINLVSDTLNLNPQIDSCAVLYK